MLGKVVSAVQAGYEISWSRKTNQRRNLFILLDIIMIDLDFQIKSKDLSTCPKKSFH